MNLYTPEKASHWYTKDGQPAYDADLRRARKEGLLPSVTTVLKAAARPGLESWRLTQGVLSALTLPRKEGEDLEAFAQRVVADSNREAGEAADWGSRMHKAIELALTAQPWEDFAKANNLLPWMDSFATWLDTYVSKVISCEEIVVNKLDGYAGKLDLSAALKDGRFVVADFKGRNVKDGKVAWYKEQARQLAAYRRAKGCGPNTELMSVVIDRNKPEIHTRIWTGPEAEDAEKAFLALNAYWQRDNNYYP